jgi:hypothetical protein
VPTATDLVRDLGPFWNLARHSGHDAGTPPGAPVFYGDIAKGVRVELTLPEACPGLSANSLLMLRPDGAWEVFDDDGLLVTYAAGAVRVALAGVTFRSDEVSSMNDAWDRERPWLFLTSA